MEILDDSCDAQLEALWQAYANPPVAPVAGCDEACIQACGTTLNWGLYSEKVQDCPVQEDMVRCFHVSVAGAGRAGCSRGRAGPAEPSGSRRLAHVCCAHALHALAAVVVDCLPCLPASMPALLPCLQVYRAQWLKFVNQCALFQYGVTVRAPALMRWLGCAGLAAP